MNANEVLANRAAEILGDRRGTYDARAPQRSRQHGTVDQRRLSDGDAAGDPLRAARSRRRPRASCRRACTRRAARFSTILKTGRTHLQDAVPITLGQEFGGYAANVAHATDELERTAEQLHELNLGATAVGTGLNAGDDYTREAIAQPGALHGASAACRRQPVQGHAEHGRCARVLRRAAAAVGRSRQDRVRPAAAEHGAAGGHRRNHVAGGAAGIVDHARQGQSVGAGDGQPGLLPGDRLRRGDPRRGRRRAARTERHDAGHRVERVARDDASSDRRCTSFRRDASAASRPTPRARASCSIAAPRSRRRSARTSATLQTADIAKLSVETGRPIREIVRERRLMPDDALDAILVAGSDDLSRPCRDNTKEAETP